MNINLDVTGLKEIKEAFEKSKSKADKAVKDQIKETSNLIFNDWLRDLQKHRKTGSTLNSIKKKVTSKTAKIYSDEKKTKNKPLAFWLDVGTKPHVIRAKKKPYLTFFYPKINRWVRKKEVFHPGTKANNYLFSSFVRNVGINGQRFINILTRRIKKYTGIFK